MNGWIKQNEPNFFKEVFQIIYVYTHIWILDSSFGKESAFNAGIPGWVPGSGRSPGEGNGYPLQYSSLENSMDSIVYEVIKNRTQLSDCHSHSIDSRSNNNRAWPFFLYILYVIGYLLPSEESHQGNKNHFIIFSHAQLSEMQITLHKDIFSHRSLL